MRNLAEAHQGAFCELNLDISAPLGWVLSPNSEQQIEFAVATRTPKLAARLAAILQAPDVESRTAAICGLLRDGCDNARNHYYETTCQRFEVAAVPPR